MGIEGEEEDPEMAHTQREPDPLLHKTRCCFCFPCFGSRHSSTVGSSWWNIQSDEHWWTPGVRAVKKIREWSEIVAGPRWKTFIRRFNRTRSGSGSNHHRHGQFQYDPLSYSLNFDKGPGQIGNSEEFDDFGGFRDFSTRYASVSPTGKRVAAGNDVAVIG